MKLGLLIYGSLDTLSGGYLYDRKLVEYLRGQGDTVEIISLPWRNYVTHLTDNIHFRLHPGLDLLIQDELNHPSLLAANRRPHPYPIVSLVHHLRASEPRPTWQNWFYHAIEKRYLASVDAFIFNSNTTKSVVDDVIGSKMPHVVANPPTDRFRKGVTETEIEARSKEPGPLRILFVGNVIYRKGLHTLMEALEQRKLDIRLEVVGSLTIDRAYGHRVQRMAAVAGQESRVRFHGPLNHDKLAVLFKSSHVLVVPSSYEGFGIVYLEGMAFGLPAIGTTSGAAWEIINNAETGYLVRPENAAELSERLAILAGDRNLLVRMSLQALERFRQQPTWVETAGKIHKFLHAIVTPPEGGSQ